MTVLLVCNTKIDLLHKKQRTHSPLCSCYLLWAAECMSLRASDPQLQNTSLLLKKMYTTTLVLKWQFTSEKLGGNICMPVLSPQQ